MHYNNKIKKKKFLLLVVYLLQTCKGFGRSFYSYTPKDQHDSKEGPRSRAGLQKDPKQLSY